MNGTILTMLWGEMKIATPVLVYISGTALSLVAIATLYGIEARLIFFFIYSDCWTWSDIKSLRNGNYLSQRFYHTKKSFRRWASSSSLEQTVCMPGQWLISFGSAHWVLWGPMPTTTVLKKRTPAGNDLWLTFLDSLPYTQTWVRSEAADILSCPFWPHSLRCLMDFIPL